MESLDQMNRDGLEFIKDLGQRVTVATGDQLDTAHLFQRLSIGIQRQNAIAIRGTVAYLEFGQWGEHTKEVWGTEVHQKLSD